MQSIHYAAMTGKINIIKYLVENCHVPATVTTTVSCVACVYVGTYVVCMYMYTLVVTYTVYVLCINYVGKSYTDTIIMLIVVMKFTLYKEFIDTDS